MLASVLLVIDIIAAIAIIVLVLLQQGKGSDMGAAFGGGGSQSVFGSRGSANFFSRATSVLATLFFVCSLALAYVYSQSTIDTSVTDIVSDPAAPVSIQPGEAEPIVEPVVDDVPVIPGDVAEGPIILEQDGASVPDIPELPTEEAPDQP